MLHILLQILFIIGVVLLCILGFVLLLLLLVLFVPIRYRANGIKNEETTKIQVRVSYLLHILSVHFDFIDKSSELKIKIFGIQINKRKNKKNLKKDQTKEDQIEEETTKEVSDDTKIDYPKEKEVVCNEDENPDPLEEKEIPAPKEDESKDSKQAKQTKIKKKRLTIKEICDKINDIKENIVYYKDVLTSSVNKKLYARLWNKFISILKSILPKKLKAHFKIGTGSPDTTGYMCALYGIFISKYGNNVILEADFENKVLEGDFDLKGKIRIFTLVRHGLPLLFDSQLKKFIKEMKWEDK